MAYHQQHNDPYYTAYGGDNNNNYAHSTYPHPDTGAGVGNAYSYDMHPADHAQANDWETKSFQSGYADSQAHLNPQYEMSQVSVPPVPNMHYAQPPQQNYPPAFQQRPPLRPDPGSPGWSSAREKLMKRRSVKQVELQKGNLVIDVPVPSHIVPRNGGVSDEMSNMRYTAATCDPDDFMRQKYSLRPYLYGRKTEIFIVMTMYNEDEVLFVKTMNA